MTPQERQSVDELFDRLARLESTPRDTEAERAIAGGLRRAPHAVYALVQTVLVQDEALKRADARIRELSGEADSPRESGSFLDTVRNALLGGEPRTSVPTVRPGASGPDPRWNSGSAWNAAQAPQQQAPSSFGGGGSLPRHRGGFRCRCHRRRAAAQLDQFDVRPSRQRVRRRQRFCRRRHGACGGHLGAACRATTTCRASPTTAATIAPGCSIPAMPTLPMPAPDFGGDFGGDDSA